MPTIQPIFKFYIPSIGVVICASREDAEKIAEKYWKDNNLDPITKPVIRETVPATFESFFASSEDLKDDSDE
jgi:hypothetical protein